jgi:hypothetical protein
MSRSGHCFHDIEVARVACFWPGVCFHEIEVARVALVAFRR